MSKGKVIVLSRKDFDYMFQNAQKVKDKETECEQLEKRNKEVVDEFNKLVEEYNELKQKYDEVSNKPPTYVMVPNESVRCDVCEKDFACKSSYRVHLNTRKHNLKAEALLESATEEETKKFSDFVKEILAKYGL